jgi:DNA-binding Lrp family transcriptional regulator
MNDLTIHYKILRSLQIRKCFDEEHIAKLKLGITPEELPYYLEMLQDNGLIKGFKTYKDILGNVFNETENVKMTMKGLEYLAENSVMKKNAESLGRFLPH